MNKKILVITAFMLILLISCGKNKITHSDDEQKLHGYWEWVSSAGGIAGVYLTPDSVGYNQELLFGDSGTVVTYRNKAVHSVTTYTIEIRELIGTRSVVDMIVYANQPDIPQYFEFSANGDTLFLMDNIYDGFNHIYVKHNLYIPHGD